jgi:type I restriction enzyme, R subunit
VLLNEIIAERKAKALEYEAYMKRMEVIARQVNTGQTDGTPSTLDTDAKRKLYNNLEKNEALALKLDAAIRHVRPDGWRGVKAREQVIKAAMYGVLGSETEVERMFLIVQQQHDY